MKALRPYAWTAAAFAGGLALHIDRIPLWATAAAFISIIWGFLAAKGTLRRPKGYARVVLALILLIAVFTQFRTLNGLNAGTALLAVMGSIKLLETRSRRDRYIVVGAALFLLLAACLDRQSLLRAPLYLLESAVACAALAVIAHDGASVDNRAAVTLAARNLLYAGPLALILFVFFPRLAGSFWALAQNTGAATGLSDTMSPGSISDLSESDEVAFRVRFDGVPPPPQERYWRGPVLHDFDGLTWRRIAGRFYRQEPVEFLGPAYRYRVTLEPSSTHWWFALDLPVRSSDTRAFLTYDRQLVSTEAVSQPTSYEALSYTHSRAPEPVSTLARRYDTELPFGRNPRSLKLARNLRASAGTDPAFVDAVLERFRSQGFEYTLTPPLLDYDSVDDFLFNTKRGFCGHYASAFVTLMRAGGVPARVVTGYQGGEWNPIGGYYVVRQSDAHAWAEVWLEGRGWTRVDPTAMVAPERLRRGLFDLLPGAASAPTRLLHHLPWLNRARQSWDALNAWWNDSVLRFDFNKQLDLLRKFGIATPDWEDLGWALAAGSTLWLAWIAWRMSQATRPPPLDPLTRAYAKLCRKLARAGLPRAPYQGPIAYSTSVARQRPDLASLIRPLFLCYAQLRYGAPTEPPLRARAIAQFDRAASLVRV